MANLILLLIALAVIAFIWLMWLRHGLLHALSEANHQQGVLMHDLEKRRDTVPYLLESYRAAQEQAPGNIWHQLLTERAAFHEKTPLEKEWEFEKNLLHFIRDEHVRTQNYLEAKKDIEDLTMIIEKEKTALEQAAHQFNTKKKQFPYTLASAIFGLQEVQA